MHTYLAKLNALKQLLVYNIELNNGFHTPIFPSGDAAVPVVVTCALESLRHLYGYRRWLLGFRQIQMMVLVFRRLWTMVLVFRQIQTMVLLFRQLQTMVF